jgi:hypothetical protein
MITVTGAAVTGTGVHIVIAVMMDGGMTADGAGDGTGTAVSIGGDDNNRPWPIEGRGVSS